ncbi:MAG: carbohydrate ABC transporter permease [Clostridiales bacterium]
MIKSKNERTGDLVIAFVCFIFILLCLLPMISVMARSLSSPNSLIRNDVTLWPVDFTLDAYSQVLNDTKYTWSLIWTAILTIICTITSVVMTAICAYPLTYEKLKGRRFINLFIIFTMYFNAGIIPNYLLFNDLNLINNPLVLIMPASLSVFYMIIMRSFMQNIPESIRESAEIDGAGPIRILISIYLPLSTPVIATLALFYAVGRWNGFSDALMYMSGNEKFYPIQLLLYNIINSVTQIETINPGDPIPPGVSETLKAATVMFATIPILFIYPWLQKYFIHGVTLGAEKG